MGDPFTGDQRGHQQHGEGRGLLFSWLTSLRISSEDAREYTNALVALGFDDLQSIREDAGEVDLLKAGMKTGHIRRAFKALHSQGQGQGQQEWQHEPHDIVVRGASPRHTDVFDSNDNNKQHQHTANDGGGGGGGGGGGAGGAGGAGGGGGGGGGVQTAKKQDSGIVLPGSGGSGSVFMRDDGQERRNLFAAGPGHGSDTRDSWPRCRATHDDGSLGTATCARGSAPLVRRKSAGRETSKSSTTTAPVASDKVGPSTPIQRLGTRLWSSCKRPHGPAVAKPLWRTLSEDDAIPAEAAAAASTVHSEGERPLLPDRDLDGSSSPSCSIFDSASRRERNPSHMVAARQQFPDHRLRQGMEGGGGDGSGGGSGGVDGNFEELNSTDIGLDYANEVFDGVTSSVESPEDVAQTYAASRNHTGTSSAAGGGSSSSTPSCRDGGHPRGSASWIRRRMRMDVSVETGVKTEALDPVHRHGQQPLFRVSTLGSSSRGGAEAAAAAAAAVAAEKSKPVRAFSVDTEPAASRSVHGGTLFSNQRQGFYSSEEGSHSTPSINTLPASASGGRRAITRGEPPGRMEIVPSPRAGRFGAEDMGDVLGRGGHVKTIQRIRSTGRLGNNPSFLAHASGNDVGDGSDGGGKESRTPRRGSCNQVGYRPMAMAPETMAAELGSAGAVAEARDREAEDVPEDIDVSLKRGEGSPLAPYEGGKSMAPANPVVCRTRSSELSSGRDQRTWGARPLSAIDSLDSCTGSGGLGGLSLDLGSFQAQGFGEMEQSYDLSEDGGTLKMHGFVLKPDGMKSTPTPSNADFSDSRSSASAKMSYEDRMRALRPSTLQMSDYRTPCSRDSSFGGGGVRGGGGSGRGEGGGGGLVPPPPPLTTTPRRTREPTILLEEIGRGGGGTVHKAIHVPSMRLVAVKMVEVHDDDKRRQILQELKTLHSMKTVPLMSPKTPAHEHVGRAAGLCGWDEWSLGSLESSSGTGSGLGSGSGSGSGSWRDDDSPNCEPGTAGGGDSFSGTDGGDLTRTTATLSSRGDTLSSRDGTPSSGIQRQRAGRRRNGDNNVGIAADQGDPRVPERRASTCEFTPTNRGSGDGVRERCSSAGDLTRSTTEQRRRRESSRSGRDLYLPVVTFHDAYMNRERGRVCMVMEYMDGGTLQQFVTRREVLSEPALAAVAHSVLRGLAEMHAKRKIHRDIKPSNILLDRQGRVKISDFGVVRQLNETGSFAQTFTGTVTYMSPERIKDSDHSYPSDVWSLGMVIAALALGRFPLSTSSTSTDHMFDLIQAITEDPVPALSPQSFSPELCDFVELMLRRDPGERPTAVKLLTHPFLQQHQDQDSVALAAMVKVSPASPTEVQRLLKKVVDYHLAVHPEDRRERNASFFDKDTLSGGGWSPQIALPPSLRKEDVEVLAQQLQVTRTELVKEYELIRKRAEWELWGDTPPRSAGRWRRGNGSRTPGVNAARPRRPNSMSVSSPQGLDAAACPPRHECSTPQAASSAFSTPASRQRRREGGTPAGRSSAMRRSSPSCSSGEVRTASVMARSVD